MPISFSITPSSPSRRRRLPRRSIRPLVGLLVALALAAGGAVPVLAADPERPESQTPPISTKTKEAPASLPAVLADLDFDAEEIGYDGPALDDLDLDALDDILAGLDDAEPVDRVLALAEVLIDLGDQVDGLDGAVLVLEERTTTLVTDAQVARDERGRRQRTVERAEATADRIGEHRRRTTDELTTTEAHLAEAAVAAYMRPPGADVLGAITSGRSLTVHEMGAPVLFESVVDHHLDTAHGLRVDLDHLAVRAEHAAVDVTRATELAAEAERRHRDVAAELDRHRRALSAVAVTATAARERLEVMTVVMDDAIAALPRHPSGTLVRSAGGDDVELVTIEGITVAASIAPNLAAMLAVAAADGIELTGWGYRSFAAQIDLRRSHCGETDEDVWRKPPSACNPPTAVPGTSLHERGLAVDFAGLTARNDPRFVWLAEHAAEFGFFNLPSEPWHWSVDGR